ncbi:MAG: hypothetical protein WDM71_06545 [Ferruginibacter sp.]
MLAAELINTEIPALQLNDTVGKALQLFEDFRVTHLPVISDKIFLGLKNEDALFRPG